MKRVIFLFFVFFYFNSYSQSLRDSVHVKTDVFEIIYSEKFQQPLYAKYMVNCFIGKNSRKGMFFYRNDTIVTSDDNDYINNIYDKGHLAPAGDFLCSKEKLYQTFSYLNCSLQNQNLNRGIWKLLEFHERDLAKKYKIVQVEIFLHFSKNSVVLPSGATVPDSFEKVITYNGKIERYLFKNEPPLYYDINKYLIK